MMQAGMKRPREGETLMQPSKVLYVRNLPDDAQEDEIMNCAKVFGNVPQILLLKDKRSCFVEFTDLDSAIACYDHYKQQTLTLGGKPVEWCYSNRNEITRRVNADNNPPNPILLVTITNVMYPVTVEVMQQVFSRVGNISKVVIFERGQLIQAFVEMVDTRQAMSAKQQFDGQCIYNGCNQLKIQYSGMPALDIKSQSERSWDFSLPGNPANPPPAAAGQFTGLPGGATAANPADPYNPHAAPGGFDPANPHAAHGAPPGAAPGQIAVAIVHGLNETDTKPDDLAALFAVYGNIQRVKIMYNKRSTALVQFDRMESVTNAMAMLTGTNLHGNEIKIEVSKGQAIADPRPGEELTRDYSTQKEYNRYKTKPLGQFRPGNCLHIANMPDGTSEENIYDTCQTIGGHRPTFVKFLDERKHQCVAKFDDNLQSIAVLIKCHNQPINGRPMRVGFGHMNENLVNQANAAAAAAKAAAAAAPGGSPTAAAGAVADAAAAPGADAAAVAGAVTNGGEALPGGSPSAMAASADATAGAAMAAAAAATISPAAPAGAGGGSPAAALAAAAQGSPVAAAQLAAAAAAEGPGSPAAAALAAAAAAGGAGSPAAAAQAALAAGGGSPAAAMAAAVAASANGGGASPAAALAAAAEATGSPAAAALAAAAQAGGEGSPAANVAAQAVAAAGGAASPAAALAAAAEAATAGEPAEAVAAAAAAALAENPGDAPPPADPAIPEAE